MVSLPVGHEPVGPVIRIEAGHIYALHFGHIIPRWVEEVNGLTGVEVADARVGDDVSQKE